MHVESLLLWKGIIAQISFEFQDKIFDSPLNVTWTPICIFFASLVRVLWKLRFSFMTKPGTRGGEEWINIIVEQKFKIYTKFKIKGNNEIRWNNDPTPGAFSHSSFICLRPMVAKDEARAVIGQFITQTPLMTGQRMATSPDPSRWLVRPPTVIDTGSNPFL